MAQQLNFFVDIPGVPMHVLPEEALCDNIISGIRMYTLPSKGVVARALIVDSRQINLVVYELRNARPDYLSLMKYGWNKKLLEENKVTEKDMYEAFNNVSEYLQRYRIFAEITDSTPEKRGHKLPKGKDVALYRGAKLSGENVDASGVEPIFLSLPKMKSEFLEPSEEDLIITEEWRGVLGAVEGTRHYPADLDHSKKYLDGLNALMWDFRFFAPNLFSNGEPRGIYCYAGVLLGSRLSADE
jgi:hypothetical protein